MTRPGGIVRKDLFAAHCQIAQGRMRPVQNQGNVGSKDLPLTLNRDNLCIKF